MIEKVIRVIRSIVFNLLLLQLLVAFLQIKKDQVWLTAYHPASLNMCFVCERQRATFITCTTGRPTGRRDNDARRADQRVHLNILA